MKIKIILILTILVIAIGILLIIKSQAPKPTPTPSIPKKTINPQNLTPLQTTTLGKTPEQELINNPNLTNQSQTPTGLKIYEVKTPISAKDDLYIVKNGVVVFENHQTPQDPQIPGYAITSTYINVLGQPEEIIKGSARNGPFLETYVYPQKGFAFAANPTTNEVYEVQTFTPTTLQDYKKEFGYNIETDTNHQEQPK